MTEEGHHRNLVIETLHNTKLPSYAVWTHDDIERIDVFTNLEWWEGAQKTFIKKNTKNAFLGIFKYFSLKFKKILFF